MRAAPTQKPPIASAEAPHLLPPPMADDPIHNRDLADRRPARRSSTCASRRVGASVPSPRGGRGGVQLLRRGHLSQALKRLIFYPHLWPMIPSTTGTWPIADPPGAARLRLAQGRSVRSVPSRQTRMPAAPTQRSPIASAEAPHLLPHLWPMIPSTTGTWPTADPPGAARLRLAQVRSVRSSPRGGHGCVQLPRRSHLSQAPKRLIFYPHLWPMIPSITGTRPIADPPGAGGRARCSESAT